MTVTGVFLPSQPGAVLLTIVNLFVFMFVFGRSGFELYERLAPGSAAAVRVTRRTEPRSENREA